MEALNRRPKTRVNSIADALIDGISKGLRVSVDIRSLEDD
jgi:hypothetical protein